ncbi:hypothetical protein IOLA_158 [uncultured bacterium]|nr:hypothetical protein IOLA_158 [uncultured bacterium]
MSDKMVFFENLIIFHTIAYASHNYDTLQICPIYIYFTNHALNTIPEFLQSRKEIGIVIQKQFEGLVIDKRHLSVGLFFDGVLHNLKIDLSTIYIVEVENLFHIKFDNRIKNQHISANDVQHISDIDYLNKINQIEQILFKNNENIIYDIGKNTNVLCQEDTTKIIDISDIINDNEEKN